MRIVMFGPPGVGKGTLSMMIAEKYNVPHLSTGDVIRAEIKKGNKEMKHIEKGSLVPDSIVNKIVENELQNHKYEKGFILDGYPRTIAQAEFLDNVFQRWKKKIDVVLNLKAPEDLLVRRLASRRVCSKCGAIYNLITVPPKKEGICDVCAGELIQRKDDNAETVRERIEIYNRDTKPVMGYYKKKGMLIDIDSSTNPEKIFGLIVKALSKF